MSEHTTDRVQRFAPSQETLEMEAVPSEQLVNGSPQTGWKLLASLPNLDIGVWEHSPGTSTDTEDEEVFVVLSGRATVLVRDQQGMEVARHEFSGGDVGILEEGALTTWIVHETLRKVFVARSESQQQ